LIGSGQLGAGLLVRLGAEVLLPFAQCQVAVDPTTDDVFWVSNVNAPELNRPIRTPGGERPSVRAEHHAPDPVDVAGEGLAARLAAGDVPESHGPITAAEGQRPLGDRWLIARALAGLARLATQAGDHADAARQFGAADALREATATFEIPTIQPVLDRDLAVARAALDEGAFVPAWAEGHAMSVE
jgi:hypothetical protein